MKKGGRPRSPLWEEEGLRDRIELVLELAFGGKQVRAADALGVPQSVISKMLAGKRPPNKALLDRLAALPNVNEHYLFRGEGEPLLASGMGTLPIADIVLPGGPAEYRDLLAGDRHPVAASLDRGTRYWLRLGCSSPIVLALSPRFLANDLLLIECDRGRLDRPDAVDQQLCAVRLRREPNIDYQLGQVLVDGRTIRARLFDSGGSWAPQMGVSTDALVHNPRRRAIGSLKERATARKTRPSAPKQSTDEGMCELAGLRDVVGLVLRLERLPALP